MMSLVGAMLFPRSLRGLTWSCCRCEGRQGSLNSRS